MQCEAVVLLILGSVLLLCGALALRFPLLVDALREGDPDTWKKLGSPSRIAFSKTFGLFSWILARGFEQSASPAVRAAGRSAMRRAQFARNAMLLGATLMVAGGAIALWFASR